MEKKLWLLVWLEENKVSIEYPDLIQGQWTLWSIHSSRGDAEAALATSAPDLQEVSQIIEWKMWE